MAGALLILSFPPYPSNPLIFIAFIPLFVLFETHVVPAKVPEDKIFRPTKSLSVVIFRLLTLQFLWRRETKGMKVWTYRRKVISGNAQLFRYSYAIFLIWNLGSGLWLFQGAVEANSPLYAFSLGTAGILAIFINPALMTIPFQFLSRIRWIFKTPYAVLSLIVFWVAFEYLHFRWDLSWPWLTLGHALGDWPSLYQYAEYTGVGGVSLWILLVNFFLYFAYRHYHYSRYVSIWKTAIGPLILLLGISLGWILNRPEREVFQPSGEVMARMIQPDVDPFLQRNYFTAEAEVLHLVELATQDSLAGIDLLVLPELALPGKYSHLALRTSRILQPLWNLSDSLSLPIVAGWEEIIDHPQPDSVPPEAFYDARKGWLSAYNSSLLWIADSVPQFSRKSTFVPFIERLPFLDWIHPFYPGIGKGDLALGDTVQALEAPHWKVGVMLGHEAAYGRIGKRLVEDGAQYLILLSDDARWGNAGTSERFGALAGLRAVETRREVLRLSNAGHSFWVDAGGGHHALGDWHQEEVADLRLSLRQASTFYVRNGDLIGWAAFYLSLLLLVLAIGMDYWPGRTRK